MKNTNTINIEEIKIGIYEKLKPSGWGDKLKTFILSSDFDKILNELVRQAQVGHRFTPPLKFAFRAFEECPYDKLKVVVVGQDPYIQLGVADGVAFSCAGLPKAQPSLRYIFKELEDTLYPDGYTWDLDLARWSNQGVLMLNTALTTNVGQVGKHYGLWQPFMAFLFDILVFQNPGLVYVFMGAKAKEWAESIPENNHKLYTTHPASAAHNKAEKWDSGDVFRKINTLLKQTNDGEIIW